MRAVSRGAVRVWLRARQAAAALALALAGSTLGPLAAAAGPSQAEAIRLLQQASFGPTTESIARVQRAGFAAYLEEQFAQPLPAYPDLPPMPGSPPADCDAICRRDNYTMYPLQVRFYRNALAGSDQLRQRVAFALNQIFVISALDGDLRMPSRMLPYLQVLDRNAFGNFRQLLTDITLNAGMGRYLDMAGNTRLAPNENYARELLQLFSIGVDELNADGTPRLDAAGQRVPAYDQAAITAFARVFTGWTLAPPRVPEVANFVDPMVVGNPRAHDPGEKTLLGGVVLPANQTPAADLAGALDNVFAHPNVGPFIGKRLIQHLVTSNPSPAYVARVAAAFRASNGDMKATLRAILLDPEARGTRRDDPTLAPTYGHLREPVLWITSLLRAFGTTEATTDFVLGESFLPGELRMAQDVFLSPSVFNFYPMDHVIGGEDLLGPEFAIYTTSTTLARSNFAALVVYRKLPTSRDRPKGTWLDLAPLEPLARDPRKLVDTLNRGLLHGRMPREMAEVIQAAVTAIPAASALARVQEAVYLVVTSPQYLVER